MSVSKPEAQPGAGSAPAKRGVPVGLIASVVAMIVVLLLPLPDTLPPAGHRMLAILAFAVVVWLTEAVSYEASAIIITSLIGFLIGTAPTIKDPSVLYGTSAAISIALAGSIRGGAFCMTTCAKTRRPVDSRRNDGNLRDASATETP
jgi:di/tricarboxylate transporter